MKIKKFVNKNIAVEFSNAMQQDLFMRMCTFYGLKWSHNNTHLLPPICYIVFDNDNDGLDYCENTKVLESKGYSFINACEILTDKENYNHKML